MSLEDSPPLPNAPFSKISVLALLVALITVLGSLALTLLLGLIACPLCFYQRSFAIGALGALAVGLSSRRARASGVVNLMAFFPAITGALIAGVHCYLEATGQLICPKGLFGFGTSPQQSLASLGLLTLLLSIGLMGDMYREHVSPLSMFLSVIMAVVLAYAAMNASPKPQMPKPEIMDKICHPPVDNIRPAD